MEIFFLILLLIAGAIFAGGYYLGQRIFNKTDIHKRCGGILFGIGALALVIGLILVGCSTFMKMDFR